MGSVYLKPISSCPSNKPSKNQVAAALIGSRKGRRIVFFQRVSVYLLDQVQRIGRGQNVIVRVGFRGPRTR